MGSKDKDEKKKKKKKAAPAPDADVRETTASEEAAAETAVPADMPAAAAPVTPPDAPSDKPRRKRRIWPIIVIVLLVLALILVVPRLLGLRQTATDNTGYEPYTVARGDMTVTLSGSGTLQPADAYTIRPLITGDILSAPFEEGDIVPRDKILYTVDSSDVTSSIEQAENNLADAERNFNNAVAARDDLHMNATGAGTVAELNVQIGDLISAGQTIAVVRDSSQMTFTALYEKTLAMEMHAGDSADVSVADAFQTYTGTVTDVSPSDTVLPGGIITREVTVEVKNPGAFSTSQTPTATINGNVNISSTNFKNKYEGVVTATLSGVVDDVPVRVGTQVGKGQTIAVIHSDSVEQQIDNARSAVRDARLNLDNQTDRLDDYTIRSPIAGTIVEKNYKEGDTLESGVGVCTIFDLSYLTLNLNVDELDIKKVQLDQPVTVTADAAADRQFTGIVTKININGTTVNGVTSYPVTIRIDDTEGLLPGMNVDATVTVASLTDVLRIPVGALLRGNFVLLQSDAYDPDMSEDGIPEGFVYTKVTPGQSNDDYVVITDGLQSGDVIALLDTTPSSYNTDLFSMGGPGDDQAENRIDGIREGESG